MTLARQPTHTEGHDIVSHSDIVDATGANIEELTGGGDTTLHDHDGISENTNHRGLSNNPHTTTFAHVTTAGGTATANLDLGTYQMLAAVCHNGATLPTSPAPVVGQWFLHTPTGRNILMQHDGTNWVPQWSQGTMLVYVDKTDGTDDQDGGTAVDGDAFATIQYAFEQVPPLYSGPTLVSVNDESYTENVVIQGKYPTGDYTLTLQGTLTIDQGPFAQTSSVQGTGATQGNIADTNNGIAGEENKLIYSSNNDEYRIIDVDAVNVAYIAGTWSAAPSGNYTIYDWGTTLTSASGHTLRVVATNSVVIKNMKVTSSSDGLPDMAFRIEGPAEVLALQSQFDRTSTSNYCMTMEIMLANYLQQVCFVGPMDTNNHSGGVGFSVARAQIERSKFYNQQAANGLNAVRTIQSFLFMTKGNIFDNFDGTGCIRAEFNAAVSFYSAVADGYNRIRNCAIGLYAYRGGQCLVTANNVYSGNSSNETAVAGSFGYID